VGRIADMPHGTLVACKDKSYRAIKFDCWLDKEKTVSLWPERWSPEKLAAKEQSMGRLDFDKRFRNIAVDEGSMVFKRHWLYGATENGVEYPGCLDRIREMGVVPDDVNFLVLGVDPSTGRKGRGNSYTAAVLLGVNTKEEPMVRHVIDVFRAQVGFDDIISMITFGDERVGIPGFFDLYKYNQARVEANAAQSYLIDNARMKTAGLEGVKVLPHETQAGNRNDPFVGEASMQTMVKDGLLRIPYANFPSTREKAEQLISELMLFPDGSNDMCMALWFADIGVRKQGTEYRCFNAGPGREVFNPIYSNDSY